MSRRIRLYVRSCWERPAADNDVDGQAPAPEQVGDACHEVYREPFPPPGASPEAAGTLLGSVVPSVQRDFDGRRAGSPRGEVDRTWSRTRGRGRQRTQLRSAAAVGSHKGVSDLGSCAAAGPGPQPRSRGVSADPTRGVGKMSRRGTHDDVLAYRERSADVADGQDPVAPDLFGDAGHEVHSHCRYTA